MMEEQKTLKQYAKEAKRRLKNGFWQHYNENLSEQLEEAEKAGVSVSKVKEYYSRQVVEIIRNKGDNDEEFYNKVKKMLDEEGEVANAIGRLTDKEYYESLNYEEKQRYSLSLSERYLKAVERYNAEKSVTFRDENCS